MRRATIAVLAAIMLISAVTIIDSLESTAAAQQSPAVQQSSAVQQSPAVQQSSGTTISRVDSNGFLGLGVSMVLDDNEFPVLAYYSELIDVRIVRCNDRRCAGGDESIVRVPGGSQTSVVLDAQGYPVMSSGAGLTRCTSPTCADGAFVHTPWQRFGIQTNQSLVLDASGNPIIAYLGEQGITIVHCNDPYCVGNDESVSTPHAPNTGWNAVMVLDAAGNPVITYQDRRNGDLQLLHCVDPSCASGGESIERVGESPYDPLWVPGLTLDAAGNPAIFYYYSTPNETYVLRCDDPNCAPGGDTTTVVDLATERPRRPTIRLDGSDNPTIVYGLRRWIDPQTVETEVVASRCSDRFCAGPIDDNTIDSGIGGIYSAFQLDATDSPVIAYQDSGPRDVLLARCGDPACSAASEPTEQLEVMHVTSCLAENGRIDTNIVNRGPDTATYRIEFGGLSPRQSTVVGGDWWRMPVTGRSDGDHSIVVKRNGVVVSDQTLTVTCDLVSPILNDPEVRVISACRAGLGYILFQFVNPGQAARPFVIVFDGVPNRSTTAPAFGQSIRAVTGRPAGTYSATITSGNQTVEDVQVVVDC